MTVIEALILGIIQGLTEFFPISSSGHLILAQHLLGLTNLENYVFFDLICHLGTLAAIVILFSAKIKSLFAADRIRFIQIFIATLPLLPFLFFMKPLEDFFGQPQYLGVCFFITAMLLYAGIIWGKEAKPQLLEKNRWRDALTIGVFQAAAILPGISRSGSTLSGASLLGWRKEDAVAFSFLLAIPTILGGAAIQLFKLFYIPSFTSYGVSVEACIAGFAASFFVGYFALSLLIKLAMKGKLMYFVIYCLILSVGTTLYFL